MVQKLLNSFVCSVRGLRTTWSEEHNFRIEILAAILVIFSIFYFHFSFIESSLCIIATTLVLAAEIVNTAVEDLCDKVEPKHDFLIAKVKDTMAGFVLVTGLGSIAVGVVVFLHHFI